MLNLPVDDVVAARAAFSGGAHEHTLRVASTACASAHRRHGPMPTPRASRDDLGRSASARRPCTTLRHNGFCSAVAPLRHASRRASARASAGTLRAAGSRRYATWRRREGAPAVRRFWSVRSSAAAAPSRHALACASARRSLWPVRAPDERQMAQRCRPGDVLAVRRFRAFARLAVAAPLSSALARRSSRA